MTSENSFVQPAIPRFMGHYDHWSMLMENFLRSKEYWTVVENGFSAAAERSELSDEQQKILADQRLKDLRAKNYLFQAIDRSILETILDKETSKGIWDSMKKKFQGNARVKRAQLQAMRKEFEILHMKEGETVSNYFARTLTIINKLRFLGEKMDEVTVIEKVLRSMVSKFDYVVCTIEESKDLYTMTVDELQSSLLVHEQRMQSHVVEEQALKTTFENNEGKFGRGSNNFRGRGRGHGRLSTDKSLVECFYCHDLGHYQYECPKKKSRESKAYFVETDEPLLLMAFEDSADKVRSEEVFTEPDSVNTGKDSIKIDENTMQLLLMAHVEKESDETAWFLDSGCSNHMSGDKSFFAELDESFHKPVCGCGLELTKNMGGSVKDVKSKAELDNITKSGEAVIIHFWASWCDASKQMDQVFSHLSTDFPNTHFLAVEAEEQPEISEAFSVSSVPYFVFVKDDKTVDTLEGADPSSLANKVARVAGSANPGEPAAPASLGMAAGPTVLETVKELAKEIGSSPQANQARPGLSDALKNRLQQLVASHPIMLFMKGNPEAPRCGFSQKVIDILKDETVKFGTFDILSDIEVREGLKLFSNWPTFPQLHCKGELLGGCDIAIAMHESGELREIFRDHGIDTIDSVEAKISGSENGKGGITQSTGLSTTLTSRLESLVNSSPVMLFMKGKPTEPKCGFSGKVVAILQEEKVAFESFDILTDEEVRQGLKVYSNWSSYPHLYIKDECWPWGDEHAADIQASLEWGDDGGEEVDGGHGGDDEEEGDGDELTGSGQNGFGNEGSGQNDSGDEDRLDGNGDEIRMEEITAGIASGAEIAEVDSGEVAIAESRSAADVNPLDFTDGNYTSAARRPRQRPAWLSDYEYGEGLSDEEYQGNFALYVDADPVSYEVAAQSSTWKCAMEAEIAAIQKNNTWVLTDLPRGATRVGVCDDPGIN